MNSNGIQGQSFAFMNNIRLRRGLAFGVIIIAALLAFEIFNYSTTDYALTDLLGDLRFLGVRWSTILAIAFCGIDFAGIARLFTPEAGSNEQNEVWYLFGAWLLAATMNAMLTWWGVSLAVLNHQTLGNAVIERGMLLRIVPIFVAVLVWLIRVLIIGTFSVAGDRLFSQDDVPAQPGTRSFQPSIPSPIATRSLGGHSSGAQLPGGQLPGNRIPVPRTAAAASGTFRPSPKQASSQPEPGFSRPEPTYHPASMSGSPGQNNAGNAQPSFNGPNKPGSQVRR